MLSPDPKPFTWNGTGQRTTPWQLNCWPRCERFVTEIQGNLVEQLPCQASDAFVGALPFLLQWDSETEAEDARCLTERSRIQEVGFMRLTDNAINLLLIKGVERVSICLFALLALLHSMQRARTILKLFRTWCNTSHEHDRVDWIYS